MESNAGADLGGGCRGCAPPPGMTCGGFLINTVQSLHSHTKSALSFDMYSQQFILCYFLVKALFFVFAFKISYEPFSEKIEDRKTLVKKSNFLFFCQNIPFSDLI